MKLTFDKIVILLSSSLIVVFIVLLYALWAHPILQVMVGYSAQIGCLQNFVSGRDPAFTYTRELSAWTAAPTKIKNNSVEASVPFLPFYKQTATFMPHIGCVLAYAPQGASKKNVGAYGEKEIYYEFKKNYLPIKPQKLPRRINTRIQKIADEYVARKYLFTRGLVIAKNGVIIAESYGDGANATTPHPGWSVTKSLLHALYGVAQQDKLLNFNAPPPVLIWSGLGDRRSKITFDEMFRMSSGLVFDETYFPPSDVTKMLFNKTDAGKFAAEKFLEATREKRWHYSSGTTNILSWIYVNELKKKKRDPIAYMRNKLFKPLGMSSMVVSPDYVGTPIGSSYGFATAEDWLKLGQLYLQNGRWRGTQIVPANWVKKASSSPTKGSKGQYSHHWWINDPENKFVRKYPSAPKNAFWASGFNGQIVMVLPSQKIVITRLGWTEGEKTELDGLIKQILATQNAKKN